MAFQGDVAQIPLSNILQALLLNGQEGILLLDDGAHKYRIRVLKQGLRLLNFSQEEPDLLRRLLLKQRALTESQFTNIFSTWVPGSTPAGDFLLSRRILTRDVVLTDLFRQIENTVLELITNKCLKYEFTADADASAYEIFSPDDVGEFLILNPNAVLMEAVRRDDEWARIRAEIPSAEAVFAVTDRAALSAKSLPVEARCLREIKPLLTGEYTLSRMSQITALCAFEVHDAVFKLKAMGLVRALNHDQKIAAAEKLRKSLRVSDAAALLRSILVDTPEDHNIRQRLIALLEKDSHAASEVAAHHLLLAQQLRAEHPTKAREHAESALAVDGSNLAALELLFTLAHARNQHREAMATLRTVAGIARASPPSAAAAALFGRLLTHYPDDASLYHELADIYLAQSNADAAVSTLQAVAELYKRRKDVGRLRKTCEQLARLRPSESARFRRAGKVRFRARFSLRRCLRTAIKATFASGLLVGAGYAANYEYQARAAYASISNDVATHKRFGALEVAKKTLTELEAEFPFSTCTRSAQGLLTELNRLTYVRSEERRVDAEKRRVQADSAFTRASLAFDAKDLAKALDQLTHLDIEALPGAKGQEAKNLRLRIEGHFEEAKRLYRLSEEAERNSDYQTCYQHRKTLCTDFPNVPLTSTVLLPIRLETIPPGATTTIDGQPVGETPILLRLPWRKLPAMTLHRNGYKDFQLGKDLIQGAKFNPLAGHSVRITLAKDVTWQFDAGASIEVSPLLNGDNLYLATRGGKVFCLRQDTGQPSWSYSTPQNMDISGGIGFWNGFVYFGAYDGKLYILDTFTGKAASEPFPATPELWPIKAAPSQPSEKGVVVVNCDRRVLSAYSLHKRAPAWTFTAPDAQFVGQPQARNDHVYLCTAAGDIYVLSHDTGVVEKKMSLGYELTVRGKLASDGKYFVAGPHSNLICLDPLQQHIDWSVDLPGSIVAPPTVEGELLLAQTSAKTIHCLTTAGELKWSRELPHLPTSETEGIIFRSNYFLGTRTGVVLCYDIWNGSVLWEYKTTGHSEKDQRGIIGAGVVGKGRLFIGSEDHFLYCLTLE